MKNSIVAAYKYGRKPSKGFFLAIAFLILIAACALLADELPLGFEPEQLDLQQIYQPPFQWEIYEPGKPFHWLGTDKLGRDLLSNLIFGCRTALLVSMPAMLIALLLGLVLGSIAGYYGDKSIQISFTGLVIFGMSAILAFFYGFYIRQPQLADAFASGNGFFALLKSLGIFIVILLAGMVLTKNLNKWAKIRKSLFLPVDQIILKCIELLSSIPRIIFILCLTAYAKPSLWNIILITGLTYWTEPARLIRAELLRIRAMHYIESAKALGLGDLYILFRHALPNALSSIIVAFTFGITSLISLEATLSFLGIGIPADIASWGKMVTSIRSNFEAWWLVVFPGLLLVCTVLSLQTCSTFVIKKLNPRSDY